MSSSCRRHRHHRDSLDNSSADLGNGATELRAREAREEEGRKRYAAKDRAAQKAPIRRPPTPTRTEEAPTLLRPGETVSKQP